MANRSKFEQRNYPEPVSTSLRRISYTGAGIVVLLIVGFFAFNYWYSCEDFGVLKFCSMIRKP